MRCKMWFTSRKKLDELAEKIEQQGEELAKLRSSPVLISMSVDGRSLKWTYMKHGLPIVVNTYATMADDPEALRRRLGIG
jgi:hypothetical protein